MNALTTFEKDHLAFFLFLKTMLFAALTAGGNEALGYINGSGTASLRMTISIFAIGFIIASCHYITSYFSKSTDPQIAAAAVVADAIVTKEEPAIAKNIQTYMGQPIQPVRTNTPSPALLGNQIANGFTKPVYQSQADITQIKTAQMPVAFPTPNQAPIAPTSAFHDLLPTEKTPIPPAQINDAWLNTTPKQG